MWLEEIRGGVRKDPVIALMVNKSDLVAEEVVDPEIVKEFTKEKGLKFELASTRTGEGIMNIFEEIESELVERNLVEEDKVKLDKLRLINNKKNCCRQGIKYNLNYPAQLNLVSYTHNYIIEMVEGKKEEVPIIVTKKERVIKGRFLKYYHYHFITPSTQKEDVIRTLNLDMGINQQRNGYNS